MAKRKKKKPATDQSAIKPPGAAGSSDPPKDSTPRPAPSSKGLIIRFVVLFAVFLVVFYVAMTRQVMQDRFFPAYLELNTSLSASLINLFGQDATATGKRLASKETSIEIRRGCDAIEPTALFVSAVLATPVTRWARLIGTLGGTTLLAIINLVRIITLFFTRIHFPKAFDMMHVEVWQGLFICLSLVLWIAWALWATKPPPQAVTHEPD
ncbi:MAG: exosortase/archaeosortase family protein [Phycisphaerae bacterium]